MRRTARALARDLDQALEQRQRGLAEQLAKAAIRLPLEIRRSVGLCERLARLRALQGDVETALAILDAAGHESSSLRLLRAACLLKMGHRDAAHIELRQWAGRPSAPLAARSLLALLEWHDGDDQAACDVLRLNARQFEDPNTLAALMLIHEAKGNRDLADRWADRLRQACAYSPEAPLYNRVLQSIGREPVGVLDDAHDEAQVETLAMELIAGESAIPALVDAQRLQPHPVEAELLLVAIARALPELDDRAAAHVAMIDLSLSLGDTARARQNAELAVKDCPMSVVLTRRLAELREVAIQSASQAGKVDECAQRSERAA